MKLTKHITVLAFALAVFAGCIREDRSDCEGDVFIHFRYMGDGETDILEEKIARINLYIYSMEDYSLYSEHSYEYGDLYDDQSVHLMLRPGNYRVIAWGNMFENTGIEKEWTSARVGEPAHFSGTDDFSGVDSLYFATTDISVPETLVDVERTCTFACSHIDMRVRLRGFSDAVDPGTKSGTIPVSVTHNSCPVHTDFTNTPSQERCDVIPEIQEDPDEAGTYLLEYNIFRISEDDPDNQLTLTSTATGNTVHEVSIKDFVARYGIQITGKNEVLIPILITLTPTGVQVIGWDIEEVDPGFDKD